MSPGRRRSYTEPSDARAAFLFSVRRRVGLRRPPLRCRRRRAQAPAGVSSAALTGGLGDQRLGALDDGRGQVHARGRLHLRQRRASCSPRRPWAAPSRRAGPPPPPPAPPAARPAPPPRAGLGAARCAPAARPRFSVCGEPARPAAGAAPPPPPRRRPRAPARPGPVFFTYCCTTRLCPSPRMASSAASSDCRLSQTITPCFSWPCSSFTSTGTPPTSPTISLRSRRVARHHRGGDVDAVARRAAAASASCCAPARWPARVFISGTPAHARTGSPPRARSC